MKNKLFILTLILFFSLISQGYGQESYLIKLSPVTPENIKLLAGSSMKVCAKAPDFYLAEANAEDLEFLKDSGLSYKILDTEPEFSLYYFVWAKPGENISKYLDKIKEKAMVLEAEGKRAIIKGNPVKIEGLTSLGLSLKLIRKKPLPITLEQELPAFLKSKAPAYDSVIAEIIQKITTPELSGWVGDLSGENQVDIGGFPYTIFTRRTDTEGCDKAAQFIKEKFESFGLATTYDTFTVPHFYLIGDIISTPDGDTAWLACNYSGIWKTTDAGNGWYNISGTRDYEPMSLCAPSAETLYAVCNSGIIIKATDTGETWFELSSPTSQNLRGIYFENSQCGWVAGHAGTILYTDDGGQSWTLQNSGITSNLLDVTFSDSNNGWAVGDSGKILHTSNRGLNWDLQNSGTNVAVNAVAFATPKKGWVCGRSGYLRYTEDAGASWNSQTSGTSNTLYRVAAPDSMHAWASGVGNIILHTADAGTNWTLQNNYPNYGFYYDIYFLDTLKGWVTGFTDVLYTIDGGKNWVQQLDNFVPGFYTYNVVAELPGKGYPGKEFLITAHYDNSSEIPYVLAPGADDNASGTAAVLTAANILKDYEFNYTLKFICFAAEEQGLLGSEHYAEEAKLTGDTILGVVNLDMIAYEGNGYNVMEVHAGTGTSSQALADVMLGLINDYGLGLSPEKITTGASHSSDHASFWDQGYAAVLAIEDHQDFNPYYHSTDDLLSAFDLPYFTDLGKAGIASLAILAHPYYVIYGDANDDHKVSISDVVYLINYLFKGGPPPVIYESGNADCVNGINITDVIFLINYLFKGGEAPGC